MLTALGVTALGAILALRGLSGTGVV